MSDHPAVGDLLDTARAAVLDELLAQLPPSAHYTARMVAQALAIAARSVAAPPLDAALRAELATLAGVAAAAGTDGDVQGADAAKSRTDAQGADADELGRRLAQRIRGGAFSHDADARMRLHAALRAWTRARLAVTDPRAAVRGVTG